MFWLASTLATAAGISPPTPDSAVFGVRLLGEAIADPALSASYGAQGLGGEIELGVPLPHSFRAFVEAGYIRRGGNYLDPDTGAAGTASWMWYAPLALAVEYVVPLGPVSAAAGAGPAYLLYAEKAPVPDDDWGENGGKFGFLVEGRVAMRTNAVQPTLHAEGRGPSRLDVALTLGYRHSFRHIFPPNAGTGDDFSAARVGLGVELVY